MSEIQRREPLNRFLAETVMGWDSKLWGYLGLAYERTTGSIWSHEWSPTSVWRDCEPLLNKIEQDGWEWSARNVKRVDSGAYYEFALTKTIDAHLIVARSESRTEALCLAIARAYGWKEER